MGERKVFHEPKTRLSLVSIRFGQTGCNKVRIRNGFHFVNVEFIHSFVHNSVQIIEEINDIHGRAMPGHQCKINNRAGN